MKQLKLDIITSIQGKNKKSLLHMCPRGIKYDLGDALRNLIIPITKKDLIMSYKENSPV